VLENHCLFERVKVRSIKVCSSRSWRCCWYFYHCFGLLASRHPLGW